LAGESCTDLSHKIVKAIVAIIASHNIEHEIVVVRGPIASWSIV